MPTRRWLLITNLVAAVLDDSIGHNWRTDFISNLVSWKNNIDYEFFAAVQKAAGEQKAAIIYIAQKLNIVVNPAALFDVQIKPYSWVQTTTVENVLHVITRYNRILEAPDEKWVPK